MIQMVQTRVQNCKWKNITAQEYLTKTTNEPL